MYVVDKDSLAKWIEILNVILVRAVPDVSQHIFILLKREHLIKGINKIVNQARRAKKQRWATRAYLVEGQSVGHSHHEHDFQGI